LAARSVRTIFPGLDPPIHVLWQNFLHSLNQVESAVSPPEIMEVLSNTEVQFR